MGQAASALFNGTGAQLMRAVNCGDADAVCELVSAHPELLAYRTSRQFSACHLAARAAQLEVLQQLISKAEELEFLQSLASPSGQLQPQRRRSFSRQPQQRQARAAPPGSLVRQLVNATNDRGVTPLTLAVDRGDVTMVKLLLAKGADPWVVDKLGGRTALHYAAHGNRHEVARLLIEAAGSGGPVAFPNRPNTRYIDLRTQTGFTPTHFAVHANAQQALALLLSAGANPALATLFDCLESINCPRGSAPLHLAARQGHEVAAKQLLKAYVETWQARNMPDPRLSLDGDDQLPCQIAARRGHRSLAHMLLPSTPLASLFTDASLTLLGPPSLASLAAATLRAGLEADLGSIEQGGQPEPGAPEPQQQQKEQQLGAPADVAPAAAAREAACSGSDTASDGSVELCGVCFDRHPVVTLAPCSHALCVSCCRHLLALDSRCVMVCPFCRAGVAGLTAHGTQPLAPVPGGATRPAAAAQLAAVAAV